MRPLLFIISFCCAPLIVSAQIPDFYKEYVTMEIRRGSVEINGIYQLRNNEDFDQKIVLSYPFPLDSMYGEVSHVYAFETVNDSTVNRLMAKSEKGAMVGISVAAGSEKTLYIGYVQKLKGNKAEYILTTTKKWNKPLESSQLELIVPVDYLVEHISYQPVDTIVSDDKIHYFIQKRNFMPEWNLIVWFRAPE